jgi:hypothetical protein
VRLQVHCSGPCGGGRHPFEYRLYYTLGAAQKRVRERECCLFCSFHSRRKTGKPVGGCAVQRPIHASGCATSRALHAEARVQRVPVGPRVLRLAVRDRSSALGAVVHVALTHLCTAPETHPVPARNKGDAVANRFPAQRTQEPGGSFIIVMFLAGGVIAVMEPVSIRERLVCARRTRSQIRASSASGV